ncbi:aminotransferase class V-fold PLP-dependent enzyme [Alphaproteobacteria bacterium]|nr:aminotransferase class V-fold PLP-dependent enzyme [Alphaproteobacteria bacterium]MDC3270075.1 aminotransferase class V-fold PLP-dependent enzyme [Alphaproteobacteria bacterium]
MNISNTKLDLDFVRSQFPAFKDPLCKDWSFFENAGGSYVPQQVIDRLNNFMISTKVQPYAEYPMSKIAGDNMDKATDLFAKMINANKKEIIIGGSTSVNLYVLSNALKYSLKPGDEVIVTNQDHEANISPWRRLSEIGATIIEWKINPETAELDIEAFENLLTNKTKIVAVTHCSNIVGTVNNLKKITELAHIKGAIVIGDGVSFAPHGFPDVKELGVDFYTFSLYKTYGPHLALLYGKEDILKKLPNQNHQFLENSYPYTINPGGPNHEELASLIGIYEYMMELYKHHFDNKNISIREKINQINELISAHEEEIANPILEYISKKDDLVLIGKNKIKNKNRAPTISFISKNKTSSQVSNILINNKIATRNDNFYAWRCLEALKINTNDGLVRLSMTHYNSFKETENVINSLQKI